MVQSDNLHAKLAEIDENVARSVLQAQHAAVIARRKAIYENLYPETRRGVVGGIARQNSASEESSVAAFTSNTATAIGRTRRTVEIAVARGEALGELLNDIAGTSLVSAWSLTRWVC
jgi:hypothetical protein